RERGFRVVVAGDPQSAARFAGCVAGTGSSEKGKMKSEPRGRVAGVSNQSSVISREISSADRRAVRLLLAVPHHSDTFHAGVRTATVSAVHGGYQKAAGSRHTAIGEQLESLMALALPHPSHD